MIRGNFGLSNAVLQKPMQRSLGCPTKRAPDGWDSARFLGLVLRFGSIPFPSFFLPSRR